MIEGLEEKLGTQGKGKESLQLTQGLGEDKEKDSGDEEYEEEGNKVKALVFISPPSKKAESIKPKEKGIKEKIVVESLSPQPPTKPRTRAEVVKAY